MLATLTVDHSNLESRRTERNKQSPASDLPKGILKGIMK